ncbi:conserved hypothetical protein [Burkholderia sp. 8Y]|nr:conserved hypothetical protein [Burkholderia sp. 8Y]
MRVAPAHRRLAAREKIRVHVGEHRDLHVEQRHVDVLAFARSVAMAQRRQHADGRVHAGHQVRDRDAGFLRAAARLAVALAGDAHEPADALNDEVVARALRIRTRLAEARHRAIDDVRLHLLQRFIVEPVLLQLADLVVLQHDIALRGQLAHDALAFFRGDIHCDGPLVAIRRQIVGGFARVRAVRRLEIGWTPVARVVTGVGPLDLDDVRAEIGQGLRAPRARQHAGQIEYADMAQGSHSMYRSLKDDSVDRLPYSRLSHETAPPGKPGAPERRRDTARTARSNRYQAGPRGESRIIKNYLCLAESPCRKACRAIPKTASQNADAPRTP